MRIARNSACGKGAGVASFGLVGADEERTRPPNSSRSSHHDEPRLRPALGERQVLQVGPAMSTNAFFGLPMSQGA